jgi:hypothetical protein
VRVAACPKIIRHVQKWEHTSLFFITVGPPFVVNVKLSLGLIKHHDIKTYGEVKV